MNGANGRNDRDTSIRCGIIVRNGYVITLDRNRKIYVPGAVAITGNTIIDVGPEGEILKKYSASQFIDALGGPVHPGFIDAHNHIFLYQLRGLTDEVLESQSKPITHNDLKALMNEDDEYVSTAHGCLEMLRNGFTAFVEPGTAFATDAVAAAVEAVGVRAFLADPYLWDRAEEIWKYTKSWSESLLRRASSSFDRSSRILGNELRRNKNPDSLVRGYVALYGLGTASDELTRAAKACAKENGVVLQQHEGYLPVTAQVEKARLGRTPIQHLAKIGVLDKDSTLVHLNALEDEDEEIVIQSGISIVWCPHIYMQLGIQEGARCRIPNLYRRGVNVALGTDSARSCIVGDAAIIAHYLSRHVGEPITAADILGMQTINAATAAGWGKEIGSLEPGKLADIVVRSMNVAEAQPGVNLLSQLALTFRAPTVDTVIVNGQIVFQKGHAMKIDEEAIYSEVRASAQRLIKRFESSIGGHRLFV